MTENFKSSTKHQTVLQNRHKHKFPFETRKIEFVKRLYVKEIEAVKQLNCKQTFVKRFMSTQYASVIPSAY